VLIVIQVTKMKTSINVSGIKIIDILSRCFKTTEKQNLVRFQA